MDYSCYVFNSRLTGCYNWVQSWLFGFHRIFILVTVMWKDGVPPWLHQNIHLWNESDIPAFQTLQCCSTLPNRTLFLIFRSGKPGIFPQGGGGVGGSTEKWGEREKWYQICYLISASLKLLITTHSITFRIWKNGSISMLQSSPWFWRATQLFDESLQRLAVLPLAPSSLTMKPQPLLL